MRVHVADHPLVTHKLTVLRDRTTPSPTFRALAEELVTLLAYEATRSVRTTPVQVETPVVDGGRASRSPAPLPLVVPILRAGLGMLEGMVKLIPTAEVGFLGMVRNEETLEPTRVRRAAARRPRGPAVLRARPDARDRRQPARGDRVPLRPRRARRHRDLPPRRARRGWPRSSRRREGRDVTIVLGALDEKLNEKGYIVPGLGDAGDRLYGTVGD